MWIPPDPPAVALTFDDGPDPAGTPVVLAELERLGLRATFFVIAARARTRPDLVREALDAGHAVELHCWAHVRHGAQSRSALEDDTDRALDALAALGVRPSRWRTPWGDRAPWTAEVAAARGLALSGWSADTHDWRGDSAEEMLGAIAGDLRAGGVVLMHDGLGPGARRDDCRETARLLAPLHAALGERGLGVAEPNPLAGALREVAAGATERDTGAAAFPEAAVRALEAAGALRATLPGGPAVSRAGEWTLLRRVAAADGSVGRILDGHLNGVERLVALAPEPLRARELDAVRAGRRRIGVWGADPAPGEGEPARLTGPPAARTIDGVKVFCSGAGGVDRAIVVAADEDGARRMAYVDVGRGVEIDRGWYRGAGLRTSESHRLVFAGAPVIAVLGGPDELLREPWFSRDALRTTACWAGIADAAAEAALEGIAARGEPDELAALAAGRIAVALATIDRWLAAAADAAGDPCRDMRDESVVARAAVADACRAILDEGARAAGSRTLARGADLDRCRRDLDLFLLQHRLEPMVARLGRAAIEGRMR